ncbi:TIGR01777 family oxidoreductase [soil metagenome]
MRKVIIAGATGFIGRRLCELLCEDGWSVQRLVRSSPGTSDLLWDGATGGEWEKGVDGSDAIINLSGAPITLPWNEMNRQLIRDSRVQSTEAIGRAITKAKSPPRVWINSSAVGYYGDRGDERLDESSDPGTGFLSEICTAWEEAIRRWDTPDTRTAWIRTGVALGSGGGAFEPLLKLAKAFIGGAAGTGRQWVPWISLDDLCRLYCFALRMESVQGPLNGNTPEPVRNSELMAKIRQAVGRPWAPPAPFFALKALGLLGGPDPSMLVASLRAIPKRPEEFGFEWKDRNLDELAFRLAHP